MSTLVSRIPCRMTSFLFQCQYSSVDERFRALSEPEKTKIEWTCKDQYLTIIDRLKPVLTIDLVNIFSQPITSDKCLRFGPIHWMLIKCFQKV